MVKKNAEDVAREMLAKFAKEDAAKAENTEPASTSSVEKEKTADTAQEEETVESPTAKSVEEKKSSEQKPNDDQKKEHQSRLNQRFAELTNKIKDKEKSEALTKAESELLKKEVEKLQKEKEALEAKLSTRKTEEHIPVDFNALEKERIEKYLKEDAEKPLSERREMSDEEWDEWFYEDKAKAQAWLTRRELRRENDKQRDKVGVEIDKKARQLREKHEEYSQKVLQKHPDLNTLAREKELSEQGKNPEEIKSILLSENPKLRLCAEIMKENQEKYLMSENGPELLVQEMERRLSASQKKQETKAPEKSAIEREIEELRSELARRDSIDTGITSTAAAKEEEQKTEFQKKQEAIAAKVGISAKELANINKRREKIPGASFYGNG